MFVSPQVPLNQLLLALCRAIDDVDPRVADHQPRVAYISVVIARHLGFKGEALLNLCLAAALHDIGLIGVENRVGAVASGQLEQVRWHPEAGYQLVKDNHMLSGAAEFIRHHHVQWSNGEGAEQDGQPVPFGSHILALSDAVEREIDRRIPVLQQANRVMERMVALSGKAFHPDCVDAFRDIAQTERFWLDTTNRRICSVLHPLVDWPTLAVDEVGLVSVAKTFGRVVDATSPWTAVHSAGVAASAVAIAERFDFSPRELHMMHAAGYLHDLGKITVPMSILNKPGRLTRGEMAVVKEHTYKTFYALDGIVGIDQIREWAAFHHERLDGTGYPFHLSGGDLTLGSRIMAVADTFTAITEDRPYRTGMSSGEVLGVMRRFAETGGLDGTVVEALARDYPGIDSTRRKEQVEYGEKQERMLTLMGQLQVEQAQ
jgi:HD-GYP domain-containing protein (c-di-GMP phosphodiesterase class II)